MQVGTVNVTSCSSKHIETTIDDGHGLEGNREKPVRKDVRHQCLKKRELPPSQNKTLFAKLYLQLTK